MTTDRITLLTDSDLLAATVRAATTERGATVDLLRLLIEVERRRLYLCQGYASMFSYCTRVLKLSEHAAYGRITVARAARRFPIVLDFIESGGWSLSTVSLLAPHLTEDNCEALLDAARDRSTREVEQLVAGLHPAPDIPSSVRASPAMRAPRPNEPLFSLARATDVDESEDAWPPSTTPSSTTPPSTTPPSTTPPSTTPSSTTPSSTSPFPQVQPRFTPPRPSLLTPIAPRRYLLRITIGEDARDKLERLRSLMRHSVPSGDPAAIVERALTVLLGQVERRKLAMSSAARSASRNSRGRQSTGRAIPAAVRRAVWARDQGRCAFIGADGRCAENAFLEFHHVVPYARGGVATVENIQLRCRAHNAYESEFVFGAREKTERRS